MKPFAADFVSVSGTTGTKVETKLPNLPGLPISRRLPPSLVLGIGNSPPEHFQQSAASWRDFGGFSENSDFSGQGFSEWRVEGGGESAAGGGDSVALSELAFGLGHPLFELDHALAEVVEFTTSGVVEGLALEEVQGFEQVGEFAGALG